MLQTECPKCKNTVEEQDIRCPNCNMRLKVVCPTCGETNNFGEESCSNCGEILIKYCPSCSSSNLPTATECRKCGTNLTFSSSANTTIPNEEEQIEEVVVEEIQTNEQIEQTVDFEFPDDDISSYDETDNIEEKTVEEIDTEETGDDFEDIENSSSENVEADNLTENEIAEQQSQNEISYEDESQELEEYNDAQILLTELSSIMQPNNTTMVTALCAEEGMGKSTIIKTFADSFTEKGLIPIIAECSELIKMSSYGCIRECLLRLLTLPDFHPDIKSFYSVQTKQLFVQNFETLNDDEIMDFMNFLYPSMQGNFEEILIAKDKTYELLDKIFQSIISKNDAIFIIDNFDYIDTASYEYIHHLIENGIINNQTKLFITYKEYKTIDLYFKEKFLKNKEKRTLHLNNYTESQTKELIKNFSNTDSIPTAVEFAINEKGKGNIFFTEQFLALLFDAGYLFISSNEMKFKTNEPVPFLPKNIEEIIRLRIDGIQDGILKDSLFTMSIMGYKFDKNAFAAVVDITDEQADGILQRLVDLMYIQKVSEYEYTFKNTTMWSIIFDIAQKDAKFKLICKKIYYIFGKYALSNPTIKAVIATYREESEISAQAWLEVSSTAAYLGDTALYTDALEQYLENTDYKTKQNEITSTQAEIAEKIGRLLYKTEPQRAIEYLTAPVVAAKEAGNSTKIIELCGYLIKACYEVCDYSGVIESVDLIISSTDDALSPLDKAIIKSKKLHALLKMGNCEEGINLTNNEILTPLEEALSKQNSSEDYLKDLFNAWFDTSINLIKIYSLQGNSKALEVADNTEEIINLNNIENPEYSVELGLSRAYALTVTGRVDESLQTLRTVEKIQEYHNPKYISQKNLIYAMNLVCMDETNILEKKLFTFAKYADDANDQFGKHMFKIMLAWLTFKSGDFNKANIIFNDELTYFAKEKNVTGALISWLFISKNTLALEGSEAAEHIAMKALEVAQNPKFSQYHIAVYLHKLIAEINLLKGDKNAAKMYLEKGMLIAKQFGLEYAQVQMYIAFAKFLENLFEDADTNVSENANKANKIYQAAIIGAEKIKVPGLVNKIKKEQENLLLFCSQNGIQIG